MTPALRMEDLFETAVGLAHEGRVMDSGLPELLDLALFVREKREVRGPFSPGVLQRAMLAPLARIRQGARAGRPLRSTEAGGHLRRTERQPQPQQRARRQAGPPPL